MELQKAGLFQRVFQKKERRLAIVKIWDRGEYELLKRTGKNIKFKLNGKRLNGTYVLLKFEKGGEKSWLLIKAKD